MSEAAGTLTEMHSTSSTSLNLRYSIYFLTSSLFKMGPIIHVALGVTVAFMVLTAAVVTTVSIAATSQYSSPVAVDDVDVTYKTTFKDIYVLKNDVDPKDGTLTVMAVTQSPYGKVQIMDNGAYIRYTPSNVGVLGPHFAGANIKSKMQNSLSGPT
jgi:hypothetical protein